MLGRREDVLVMRRWGNIVDALAFVALVSLCGMGMCNTGCGDNPCGECPSGTVCEEVPSGSLTTQRWACRQTVKVIERSWWLSVDGVPSGGSEVNGSMGDGPGTATTDSGE